MNPYQILDVPTDATDDEIKDAYRSRAKETHPDMPDGDTDEFEAVQRSYMVLKDPAKRRHYDATGDMEEEQPDNSHAAVMGALSNALEVVISMMAQKNIDWRKHDLIKPMTEHLQAGIDRRKKEAESMKEMRPKWVDLQERFTARDGTVNLMGQIARGRVAMIDRVGEETALADAVALDAIAALRNHEYRVDMETPRLNGWADATTSTSAFGAFAS